MKLLSPSCAWLALASAALLSACGQGVSTDAVAQTRAQALRVNDATGTQIDRMKDMVRPLVDRNPANLEVIQEPNGATRRVITRGFRTVMIAHKGLDGRASVACVSSVDDVDQAMTAPAPKAVY